MIACATPIPEDILMQPPPAVASLNATGGNPEHMTCCEVDPETYLVSPHMGAKQHFHFWGDLGSRTKNNDGYLRETICWNPGHIGNPSRSVTCNLEMLGTKPSCSSGTLGMFALHPDWSPRILETLKIHPTVSPGILAIFQVKLDLTPGILVNWLSARAEQRFPGNCLNPPRLNTWNHRNIVNPPRLHYGCT